MLSLTALTERSFFFINIPGLFLPKVEKSGSADLLFKVCGSSVRAAKAADLAKQVCATPPRRFVIVLCFHQHSGFVPSTL